MYLHPLFAAARPIFFAFLLFQPMAHIVVADEGEPIIRLEYQEKVVSFFGRDEETAIHFDIHSDKPISGRFIWKLSAGERTVASRESPVEVKPDQPLTVEIRLPLPPVKEGIVFPLVLEATLLSGGDPDPAATWEEMFWLFAENPFVDRSEWLASLRIHLFDPVGTTAEAFDKLDIPYTKVRNLAALSEQKPGLLIVGENVSWAAQRNLAEVVLETAAAGTPVLCLAPAEGTLPLPLANAAESPRPAEVSFRRNDVLRELDKRLGAEAWVAGEPIGVRGLVVEPQRGALVGRFSEAGSGWPWVEINYSQPRSRLIWCGWGVVRDWDRAPAPRFLMARMLKVLSNVPQPSTEP